VAAQVFQFPEGLLIGLAREFGMLLASSACPSMKYA